MNTNLPQNPALDGNNKLGSPPKQFSSNPPSQVLFGVRVDGNDGPRASTQPIAKCKVEEHYYLPAWIRKKYDVITELINTDNTRNATFVHEGWSHIATDVVPPWAALRMARNNRTAASGQWTTKRTTFQRLALDIPLHDLAPVAEFRKAIQGALREPTSLEKFQALDQTFDLGSSLTITSVGPSAPE
ncbi:hypothetical protein FRC07_007312, partial [Ceratobasidium sp. 392]